MKHFIYRFILCFFVLCFIPGVTLGAQNVVDRFMKGLENGYQKAKKGADKTGRSKSDKDRDRGRKGDDYYDFASSKKRQEERKAEEAQRVEEFVADKPNLQSKMRGNNYTGSSTGFNTGLRGISNVEQSNTGSSIYSNGLRGVSEGSPTQATTPVMTTGLRGFSNEDSNVTDNAPRSNNYEDRPAIYRTGDNRFKSDINYSGEASSIIPARARSQYSSSEDKNTKSRTIASLDKRSSFAVQNGYPKKNLSSYEYAQSVAHYNSVPVYFPSSGSSYMGGFSTAPEESLLEMVEQRIDLWREEGKHEALTYMSDKLTGFARKTVTKSSAVGAWLYRVFDMANEGVGLRKVVLNMTEKNLDAIKKSVATQNPRYVNERLERSREEIDTYSYSVLVDKGLLPPDHRWAKKKVKKVNRELAEKWIESKLME